MNTPALKITLLTFCFAVLGLCVFVPFLSVAEEATPETTVTAETVETAETADAAKPFEPLPEGNTIVTPPTNSVLLGSQIGVIVRGQVDEFYLDDEPYPMSKRINAPAASFALLKVSPGRHNVYMAFKDGSEEEIDFVVAMNERDHNGPKSWKRFYQHQFENVSNPCQKCHLTEKIDGGKVQVGHWKPVKESCFGCHVETKRNKLEEFHKNLIDPGWIEKCTDCHYVHKGDARLLLREDYNPEKSEKKP